MSTRHLNRPNPSRIATERLLLRTWRVEDREPFAELNADPEVSRHLGRLLDRSGSDRLADAIEHHFARHGFGLWAVEVPGITDFAGFVGLHHVDFDAPFTPAIEVGWRLARRWWGHGFATEGARAALTFGFTELGLTEVVSFTVPANKRSRAVMERLGMRRDVAGDFDHPHLSEGDPLRRHVLYRLRADELRAGP